MNLYIRLFLLLIKLRFKSKQIHILDETITKLVVLPNDLDINMHMNNSRYLTVMDLGRVEFSMATQIFHLSRKKKLVGIVGKINIEYLRPLKLWQKYTITTRCISWDEKWFYIGQKFESNGKVVARAVVKLLFRGQEGVNTTPTKMLSLIGYNEIFVPEVDSEFKHLIV